MKCILILALLSAFTVNAAPKKSTPKKRIYDGGDAAFTEKRTGPNASLTTDDLLQFDQASPKAKELIRIALGLTRQGLTYRYGSADPANGGMDCSGTALFASSCRNHRSSTRCQRHVFMGKSE
jgi:hypothetical protein